MQSHTVVAGDTLWALAQRFYGSGNLYPVIAAANAIPNPDHIEVGQVLSIPDTPLTDVSGTRSYTVVAGDTLSAIAQKFYGNARLFAVIAAFNKIPDPDHINVGRVLIIPAVSTVYVVAPGDTLFAIAQRFYGDGLKFGVIATFNGIGNPNLIFPGQVLAIPGVAAPTRPRSPVSALRRAVDAAEIEFDRFDALVNTSPPLAAKFGAARATAKQRLDDARSALAQAITAEPAIWADAPAGACVAGAGANGGALPAQRATTGRRAGTGRSGWSPDDIAVHSFERRTDGRRTRCRTTVLDHRIGRRRHRPRYRRRVDHRPRPTRCGPGGVGGGGDASGHRCRWRPAVSRCRTPGLDVDPGGDKPAAAGPFRVPGLAARQAGVRGHRRRHPVGPGHRPGPDRPVASPVSTRWAGRPPVRGWWTSTRPCGSGWVSWCR